MAHSKAATRPKKPHPDFPLFPHATGRWAKKVKGKSYYFGYVADDPEGAAALQRWMNEKDAIFAGKPRNVAGKMAVGDVCNHFLTYKEQLRDGGELAPRTYDRLYDACENMVKHFGRGQAVESLTAEDFLGFRAAMAKRWGPVALGNEVGMIRSVFKYAYEAGLLDKPVRFGPGFKKPSAKVVRIERAAGGVKLFTAAQIRKLLAVASPNMKAMILLGINGGLGNSDLGTVPIAAFDLAGGWLDYPRPKTGVPRRIPLWKETVAAVRAAIKARREPVRPEDSPLLFIGARGESYEGDHKGYRVAQEFDHAAKAAKVAGRTFYDLRRTFQTIAEGAHDLVAVQSVMGHAPSSGDMSAVYRQRIEDSRLRAVVDHVHAWLFKKAK